MQWRPPRHFATTITKADTAAVLSTRRSKERDERAALLRVASYNPDKALTWSPHDPNICTKCVAGKWFARWIRKNGHRGPCGIDPSHGRGWKVVPASRLAEEVDAWFRENYTQGGEEAYAMVDSDNPMYRQRGESYSDIMMAELHAAHDPSDMPIEQSPRFYMAVNLRTAASLGVSLSDVFIARANEVRE